MKLQFVLVHTILIATSGVFTSKSHPVTTLLNAKWHVTPVCLEIAEYLADESPNLFWDYVTELNSLKTPLYQIDTDSKAYKTSLAAAGKLIGPIQLSLLKLSLSMHSLSPRVQAHFQIAQEVVRHGDCQTTAFVTIGNRVACNINEMKKGLKKAAAAAVTTTTEKPSADAETEKEEDEEEEEEEEIYSFDHIYPGSENNTITTVLYGQLGSKDYAELHEYLARKAEKGRVKYISRHYIRNHSTTRVRLSGYGVELHLKSTEYKSQDDSAPSEDRKPTEYNDVETEVEGFDFRILKERYPSLSHSLDRFRSSLLEKDDEIEPLKAWEFQELGLQAAQRVAEIQGEEALQILQFTAQNFPTQAKSLLHQRVSEDFKKEMKHNIDILGKHLNIQPPDASLFVNGLFFDAESLDVGSLLETLRSDLRVLDGLHKLNIKGSIASDMLALELSSSGSKEFAIDIRDSSIIWMNDLENDAQYRRWPSSVMDLLRPTFPGMLRNIRKNLFNLVLLVDPVTPDVRGIIKLAESFVVHLAPVHLGIVFDTRKGVGDRNELYRSINCAFNYLAQTKTPRDALGYLTDVFAATDADKDVSLKTIRSQLKKSDTELTMEQIDDILGEDSDYDYGRQIAGEFLERLGVETTPQVLMNGVPLQQVLLNTDEFEETILTEILQQTHALQKAVYNGDLSDRQDVLDYLMTLPHIMPRLNQRILSSDDPHYLDLTGEAHTDLSNINALQHLSVRDMTATLMHNLRYFTTKHSKESMLGHELSFLTIWVVCDLSTPEGVQLLKNALEHMKASSGIRVAFIPNAEGIKVADKMNLNRLVWSAVNTLRENEATPVVLKWLEQEPSERVLPSAVNDIISESELHLKMIRVYAQLVLQLKASQAAVIANGKIFGPFNAKEVFTVDDFALLERLSNFQHADKIKPILRKYESDDENGGEVNGDDSNLILRLIALLVPRQQSRSRFTIPKDIRDTQTVVKLPPKSNDVPYFDIFVVLDPASRGAQKLAPILLLLRNVVNCNMRVVMSAVDKHSDMPVKNFYRFVIEPELTFQADGRAAAGPYAKFIGLPASPLLTQNLQAPENWLVEIVRSVYDLDNIRLNDINGPVHSEYELEYLLLEGHCFDSTSGAPPRGLQFTLGTKDEPIIVDTIVMANLGYFQLKANPGAWILKLRHGKSEEIYDITSAEGPNTVHKADVTRVIISSFRSHVLKLRVTKKAGKAGVDLLGDDNDQQSGIWNSITSTFSSSNNNGGDGEQVETINIFSVASGHLYERLLRIMMLSTLKHTKSPLKFWFLKNYLSPQFIDFLPHMAKEYNFQYELVQYKWPRWLHQQTEKQRTIWGYKILFLDVLFPLDVKKIIFVDADAIVRADIKELNDLDLGGAPYAYTPFCDSRKEMEGFRFWKQGYWRNHLQGRKYHISALYVVDLKRFRKVAAGDRLRGQYQALSQDPNSLSNLDQDLPNNMIHQVSIRSLPQEWLWCQTWCSDSGFERAKVIDLCNNPQTKEAKLTAAQRIVSEWKDYDSEIKNLLSRVEDHEQEEEQLPSTETKSSTGTATTMEGNDDTKPTIEHSEL